MNNDMLEKILEKKEITINDRIKFRTIFDVLSVFFTDENHISLLKVGYKVNDHQQVWFPNITPDHQKELNIKKGYANYMSKDWDYIYQYDATKPIEKRKKIGEKHLKNKIEIITFAKINEKAKVIGYHFVGIFAFDGYTDESYKTIIYKKISDNYKL